MGKHPALPVITEMEITTIKYDLPPAASCKVKTTAPLEAGEGVGRRAWLPTFRKEVWQWA